jgi:hypothetical protein
MATGHKGPQALEDQTLRRVTGGTTRNTDGLGNAPQNVDLDLTLLNLTTTGEGTATDPGPDEPTGEEFNDTSAGNGTCYWSPDLGPQTIIGNEGDTPDTLLISDTEMTLE